MRGYVIYLSSESKDYDDFRNAYGYWLGKIYKFGDMYYPVSTFFIDDYVKVYKSKKRAENMAEKIFNKCGYVLRWKIEEVNRSG